MRRKRLLVGGSLIFAIAVAGGSVVLAAQPPGPKRPMGAIGRHDKRAAAGPETVVGLAGPFGPQEITSVPSYFKRVTFSKDELGQSQEIAAQLPAGRYRVEVLTPKAVNGSGPDCMGVSFPLAPPIDGGKGFTGYVSVTTDGGAATVSCYEPAPDTNMTGTYELFYTPAAPVP